MEPRGEKGIASGGVDHQLWGEDVSLVVRVLCRYARPLAGCAENNIGHDGALISSRAFALRVSEQSFIEIRAVDLVGVCVLLVQALREVELDAFAGLI